MGDTEQTPPEETQTETEPAEPTEAPPEETPEPAEETEGEEPEAPAEDAEEKPAEVAASDAEAKEKHRRKSGYSRTIEKQEREIEFLRSQLQRTTPPAASGPSKEKTAAEQAEDYMRNVAKGVLAEERAQEQRAREQAEAQQRFEAARVKYPDFAEVLHGVSHIPVPDALQDALLTSEHGPEIMYQLASNPAELARISALPPNRVEREIGRLEAKAASSTSPPKTQPKSAARPPAPPTSVSGNSTKTRNLDDLPLSEYKKAFRSGR